MTAAIAHIERVGLIVKTMTGMKGGIPPRADEGWRQLRTRNRGVPATRRVREPLLKYPSNLTRQPATYRC